MTAFERAALAYAELGWAVFPLAENTKVPAISKWCGGKGVYDATTDATVIRTWAKQYPHANVGVACGQVSGMVVIDVDPRNGGHVALAELAAKGRAFPPGPRARTVNGGQHIFLKFDPVITGGQHRLGRGIDVKASGGYVVLAPSQVIRTDGSRGTYEWLTDPHTAALPRPPLWLTTMFKPKPAPRANDQPTAGNLASIARFVSGRTEGERNRSLYWAACRAGEMKAKGIISERAAIAALMQAATHAGLRGPEIMRTIASGLEKGGS